MSDAIAQRAAADREAALRCLGLSSADEAAGRALHAGLFACDLFGFLPVTWSERACETLRSMIEAGASDAELRPVREAICRATPVFNAACRREYGAALEAAGLHCTITTFGSEKSLHHSLQRMSWYVQQFDYLGELLRKAVRVEDIEAARRAGQLAVVCSTNCAPAQSGLQDGMDAHQWIETFHRLGVRVMHLTYNRRNWVGDGCLEPANGGLSLHGRDVIRQLNELGILVDTPHSGERTTIEAARRSRVPILASHTFCRALHDYPRGKSDDALKAIADGGGLIGICTLPRFLGRSGDLNALLDHIEHAVNLVGVEHVAIGTDDLYQGPCPMPGGAEALEAACPRPSPYSSDRWFGAWQADDARPAPETPEGRASLSWLNWPLFTAGLLRRGFDRDAIAGILGGNFLRVFQAAQDAAERTV